MDDETADMLAGALACLAVTMKVIEAIIETHPDPLALHRAWQKHLPDSLDSEIDTPPFQVAAYRNAFVENMEGISKQIAAAIRIAPGSG